MKHLKIAILFVISILLLLNINLSQVKAKEESVGYSVRAIIPENQIDHSISYFDLRMSPNQHQEIQTEIFNSSNEDINIDVHITNPITNSNGLIDYTDLEVKTDRSLKIPITKIASINDMTINIPAGESKIVPIQLEMPEKEFDGIILGGVYFEKRIEKTAEKTSGVQITNKYTYVLGLKLSETENEVKPKLHLKSVYPNLVNYHTAVIANIQNSTPVIVDKLAINAKVFNSKGKVENRVDVEDYKMAPNSSMDFVIDWKNKELKPGKYTLSLHANSGIQNWDWEKQFVIQEGKAKILNEEAVEISKDNNYLVYGLSFVILILIVVIVLLIRKNKQKMDNPD